MFLNRVGACAVAAEGPDGHMYGQLQAALNKLLTWFKALAYNKELVKLKEFEQHEGIWSGGQVLSRSQA